MDSRAEGRESVFWIFDTPYKGVVLEPDLRRGPSGKDSVAVGLDRGTR